MNTGKIVLAFCTTLAMIGGVIQYANSMPSSNSNLSEVLLTPGEMEDTFAAGGGGGGGDTGGGTVDSGSKCTGDSYDHCTKVPAVGQKIYTGSASAWTKQSDTVTGETKSYTCIRGGVSVTVLIRFVNGVSVDGSYANCTYNSTVSTIHTCSWDRYEYKYYKTEMGFYWKSKGGQIFYDFILNDPPNDYTNPQPDSGVKIAGPRTTTGDPCGKPI
jgi:hypothetical protein